MAAGDVSLIYQAAANQTVTGLGGLASSASFLAGWEGEIIDNSAGTWDDFRVTLKVTAPASPTANPGQIRIGFVGMLDDTTWPDVFDGTAGAETITDTEIMNAIVRPGAFTETDTTASRVYYLEVPSLKAAFDGHLPHKCVPFVSHNMGASTPALSGGNHQLTVKGVRYNIAQS